MQAERLLSGLRILPYSLRRGGRASYILRPMPPMIGRSFAACLGAVLIAAPLAGRAQEPESSPVEKPVSALAPQKSILKQMDEGFVEIYEKVVPAVVIIVATKKIDESEPDDP